MGPITNECSSEHTDFQAASHGSQNGSQCSPVRSDPAGRTRTVCAGSRLLTGLPPTVPDPSAIHGVQRVKGFESPPPICRDLPDLARGPGRGRATASPRRCVPSFPFRGGCRRSALWLPWRPHQDQDGGCRGPSTHGIANSTAASPSGRSNATTLDGWRLPIYDLEKYIPQIIDC